MKNNMKAFVTLIIVAAVAVAAFLLINEINKPRQYIIQRRYK